MSKPGSAEVLLKSASAARYDSLEIPGLLKHGRVSLMRELFQCGKPLPIEDLCTGDDVNEKGPTTPAFPEHPQLCVNGIEGSRAKPAPVPPTAPSIPARHVEAPPLRQLSPLSTPD